MPDEQSSWDASKNIERTRPFNPVTSTTVQYPTTSKDDIIQQEGRDLAAPNVYALQRRENIITVSEIWFDNVVYVYRDDRTRRDSSDYGDLRAASCKNVLSAKNIESFWRHLNDFLKVRTREMRPRLNEILYREKRWIFMFCWRYDNHIIIIIIIISFICLCAWSTYGTTLASSNWNVGKTRTCSRAGGRGANCLAPTLFTDWLFWILCANDYESHFGRYEAVFNSFVAIYTANLLTLIF